MAQLVVKRNGNSFPSLMTDLLDTDRFFDTDLLDLESDLLFPSSVILPSSAIGRIPSANITEREKDYLIELAAPGMSKKDFKVELENDVLSISAEKEAKRDEKENGLTRKEFSYESFCRSFRLPENGKAEKIDAKYENGILKIEIPKKEITVSKPKKAIAVA
jgi:HSP20 family protein